MSSQRAVSTCWMSNSKSGSFVVVSIIPPTPLRDTTETTRARVAPSLLTSRARARMQSSSSSGPGWAWMTQRPSRRRSLPFGERPGMAANSRPPAMTGQKGCSRGLPSGRVVAR